MCAGWSRSLTCRRSLQCHITSSDGAVELSADRLEDRGTTARRASIHAGLDRRTRRQPVVGLERGNMCFRANCGQSRRSPCDLRLGTAMSPIEAAGRLHMQRPRCRGTVVWPSAYRRCSEPSSPRPFDAIPSRESASQNRDSNSGPERRRAPCFTPHGRPASATDAIDQWNTASRFACAGLQTSTGDGRPLRGDGSRSATSA